MKWNGKSEEFVPWLDRRMTTRYRPLAGALITFAVSPDGDEDSPLTLVTMKWIFSDLPLEARRAVNYRKILLVEEWLPLSDALRALSDMLKGRVRIGDVEIVQESFYVGDAHVSLPMTGWPEDAFNVRVNRNHQRGNPQGPVTGIGLRPYSSVSEAANEWVWEAESRSWNSNDVRHRDECIIAIPDTRARIASAEWKPGVVEIRIESNVEPDQLELQAVVRFGEDGRSEHKSWPSPPAGVSWEVSAGAKRVTLYLLHVDGTILGTTSFNAPGDEYEPQVGVKKPEDRAAEDIRTCEGQYIEFKVFVEPMQAKEWEIVETIIAFANQRDGGRLYIGVRDDATLDGEQALRSAFKANAIDAMAALKKRVDALVRERVNPPPPFTLYELAIHGQPVLLVDVGEGPEKPYATHVNNDIFVRKGATNRKPDPRTELKQFFESPAPPFMFGERILP